MVVALEWGPAAGWAGAVATFLVAVVAVVVALGLFDRFRAARIRITFEQVEPWCRSSAAMDGGSSYWVRVGVENTGRRPARGCVGRLIGLTSDGVARTDVDPLHLRWAGVPRSRSFEPVDLRPGQREFLNVLTSSDASRWTIVTFDDPDFDPGFATELASDQDHVFELAVFADHAATASCSLAAKRRTADARPELALI